jgi:cellulose synthase/poly-beta-1,6-N-acetylglucosamine synthase-like glycosyltransferase
MANLLLTVVIGFVILVFLGLISIDAAGYLSRKPEKRYTNRLFRPKTLVIVPCKGPDIELYENLLSMKAQNYSNFEIVAVLDSEEDSAIGIVKRAKIKYMISRSSCVTCSGKVRAVSTAIGRFRNYEVYAIADSDIRVSSNWLGSLVAPLAERKVGLSTMYPYFSPIGGFWSKVKSVWGMVGEGLMKRDSSKFGWGGSLAFRKELLDRKSFEFFRNSKYSTSDDVCLTKIAKKKGLELAYTSVAQPVVKTDDDFGRFWEWANRQTALSVMGNRSNLYVGIPFYFAESILIASGVLLSILASPIFLVLLLHSLRNAWLTARRSREGSLLAGPIAFFIPFIYLANLLIASRKREIVWRGTTYPLRADHSK